MTRNQKLVLRWLKDHCSASGVIKCSAEEITFHFDWSRQHTRKILNQLVDDGYLSVLQQGVGRGATKYRLLSGSSPTRFVVTTKRPSATVQPVRSDNQKRFKHFSTIEEHKEEHIARTRTLEYVQNLFDLAPRVRKRVRSGGSPFKQFRKHCNAPELWKATDFVCYFSFVYKVRFGEMPTLEWGKSCGTARTLLKRLGDPFALKVFIQVAFTICKRPPKGLHSFSYGDFYEDVINREISQDILDEYDDEEVFPWLYIKAREKAVAASREYNATLTRRALGIYS